MARAANPLQSGWSARLVAALPAIAAVAVPVAILPWANNAFELPKAALLRTLVLAAGVGAVGLWSWLSASRSHSTAPPPPLVWPALAFGLTLALATAASVNPRASLWGSYGRQQGLLTLAAYLGLFAVTAAGLGRPEHARRLWSALVWASAPVVLYGLVQGAGLDPLPWRSDSGSPVLSTLGRSNFAGSYLLLVLPLTWVRLARERRRWPYLLLLAGQLVCLALTRARASWVGLGVAVLVFCLALALARHDRKLAAWTLTVVAVALLVATALMLPGLRALLPGSLRGDQGSVAARLTIWQATARLLTARPWLGYGPETMQAVFTRVYPPQLVYYQGRGAIVDRAHNLWLDLGMTAGLVGILAFAGLIAAFARLAWRRLRAARATSEALAWAALAAAVAGHLADLQFGFDLTATAAVFWLILGLASALARQSPPPPGGEGRVRGGASPERAAGYANPPSDASPRVKGQREGHPIPLLRGDGRGTPRAAAILPYLPPALALLALAWLIAVRPVLADVAYRGAQPDTQPLPVRRAAAARAVRLWPQEPEYRLGLAWLDLESGDFAAALSQLEAAARLSPGDARVWSAVAQAYARWGEVDPARNADAEAACRRALALGPDIAAYHTALGLVLAREGRPQEGLAELERAVALDATDWVAYRYLADLYQSLGMEGPAARALAESARWQAEEKEQQRHTSRPSPAAPTRALNQTGGEP